MTRYCCVCHVEQSVQNSHFIFHRIPSNPDRRKKWLEVLKKEKFNGVVCSQHFKPEDYRKLCDKQLLKPEAIPSLNIQFSEHSTSMESHKETQDNISESDNVESVLTKSVVSTGSIKSSKRTNASCDESTVSAKKRCYVNEFGIFRRADFIDENKWNRFLTACQELKKDKLLLQRKNKRLLKKVQMYKDIMKELKENKLLTYCCRDFITCKIKKLKLRFK